jgi:CRISPR system Cascade subunit CasD
MPTLLLKFVAPMQSWGVQSHFTHRDTGFEPSKSGVIGLICAALGRDLSEPIGDLAALRMGVRVDRQGVVLKDYHTAGKGGFMRATGAVERNGTILSDRFYLADAAFLVGLEGEERDRALLEEIQHHLRHPVWMLFLGRKAFPPSEPVWISSASDKTQPDGIRELPLRDALEKGHARLRSLDKGQDPRARLVLEDPRGDIVRPDQPISFQKGARQFTARRVRVEFIELSPSTQSQIANPKS